MKLKRLLSLVPFSEIKKELSTFFPKGRKRVSLKNFELFYSRLLRKKATKNTEHITIYFSRLEDGTFSVLGKSLVTEERFALDLCTFSEWLGFDICLENLPPSITISKAISNILWEMTFYGTKDEEIYYIRKTLRKLRRRTTNGSSSFR